MTIAAAIAMRTRYMKAENYPPVCPKPDVDGCQSVHDGVIQVQDFETSRNGGHGFL